LNIKVKCADRIYDLLFKRVISEGMGGKMRDNYNPKYLCEHLLPDHRNGASGRLVKSGSFWQTGPI